MFNHSLSGFASFDGEHIGHMFLFDIDDAVVLEFWNIKSSAGEIDKLSQQLVVGNRFGEFLSKQIKAQRASMSYQSDILRIDDFGFYLLTAARNWTFLSSTKTSLNSIQFKMHKFPVRRLFFWRVLTLTIWTLLRSAMKSEREGIFRLFVVVTNLYKTANCQPSSRGMS